MLPLEPSLLMLVWLFAEARLVSWEIRHDDPNMNAYTMILFTSSLMALASLNKSLHFSLNYSDIYLFIDIKFLNFPDNAFLKFVIVKFKGYICWLS